MKFINFNISSVPAPVQQPFGQTITPRSDSHSVSATFSFDNKDEAIEFSQFLLSKIALYGAPKLADPREILYKDR